MRAFAEVALAGRAMLNVDHRKAPIARAAQHLDAA
jgi:hypothetical protein